MMCQRCGCSIAENFLSYSCPLCGSTLATRKLIPQPADETIVPWETGQATQGPLQMLWVTLLNSFRKPEVFFQAIAETPSTTQALIYGLLMGSVGTLFLLIYHYFLPISISSMIADSDLVSENSGSLSPISLVSTPILILAQLFFAAFYIHAMLFITFSRKKPFRVTLKTICYAEGSVLFQIVPVVGPFLACIGWLYLAIVGIAAAHRISKLRACIVLIAPILLLLVLLAVAVVIAAIAIAVFGGSPTDLFSHLQR
jgi:hypothetical protein